MKEFYEELEGLKFKSFLFLSHQEMFTSLQASKNSILSSTALSSLLGNGLYVLLRASVLQRLTFKKA